MNKINLAILISGDGTNLISISEKCKKKNFPAKVKLVISDRDCKGYDHALKIGHNAYLIKEKNFINFEKKTINLLNDNNIQLICLAGFMKILSKNFVEKWKNRILNLHPSILPLFKGLNTHKRVLDSGMKIHGSTVHVVEKELDNGLIVSQFAILIYENETEFSLKKRIKEHENKFYPDSIKKYIIERVLKKNKITLKKNKKKYSSILRSI